MGILEALLKLKSTEIICVVLQFNVSEIVYMNVHILKHDLFIHQMVSISTRNQR